MIAQDHNKILSILFLVYGLMQIFGIVVSVLIVAGFGLYVFQSLRGQESGIFLVAMIIGIIIGALISIVPPLLAAVGFFKRKTWARTTGIIAAIFALLSLPLGTALGVYALWFLFSEDAKQFYLTGGAMSYTPPPPPQNWQ
jgi:MFS family permease